MQEIEKQYINAELIDVDGQVGVKVSVKLIKWGYYDAL